MKVKLGIIVLAGAFAVASAPAAIIATNNTFTGATSIDGWYNAGAVDAVIGYSSGAGPRQDWADNNDAVMQSPLSTDDALPAGGTITGDGLLADGGLLIDVQDDIRWNESVAFTIGGTMELDEEITLSFNSFNEKSGYQASYGQLWNKTDNVLLAQTPASVWVVADTELAYTPLDVMLSYTAQASDVGDVLEIRIMDHATASSRDIYIDNFSVTTVPPTPTLGITPLTETFTGAATIGGWYNVGSVNAVIGYSSGAGPRQDWADNDDAAVQDPKSTGDTLPAGATITGDGLLADGGLLIDVQNTTRWDESVAYTLSGTMVEGEEITFSFNAFNEKSGYQACYGQLWNKTDNVQLAQTASNIWVVADTDPLYTPLDASVSYTAQASDAGDILEIRIMDHSTSTSRDIYIDNLEVTSSLAVDTPESLYQDWSLAEGLTSSNSAYAADPDGDGLDNLAEYGLGGEPTNGANQGIASTYGTMEEGGTNWMTYVYAMRSDYSLRGLDYRVETSAGLVVASWTNGNHEVVGINVTGGDFDYVTNRIPTDVENKQFLRLGIEITP